MKGQGSTATAADFLEIIAGPGGDPLVYIIRPTVLPTSTTFLTPNDFKQQVGFIVYPAGGEVPRHIHKALERRLVGTSEVIVVKRGSCLMDVYTTEQELVATRELK